MDISTYLFPWCFKISVTSFKVILMGSSLELLKEPMIFWICTVFFQLVNTSQVMGFSLSSYKSFILTFLLSVFLSVFFCDYLSSQFVFSILGYCDYWRYCFLSLGFTLMVFYFIYLPSLPWKVAHLSVFMFNMQLKMIKLQVLIDILDGSWQFLLGTQ
jgi:hypothetical protein